MDQNQENTQDNIDESTQTTNQELEKELEKEETEEKETAEKEEVQEETQEESATPSKEAEYLDRLQRLMAEFENFRKRTIKEKEALYDLAVSSTLTELLPVVDNFERALKQNCSDESFSKGVDMIYKQLMGTLTNMGVETIEAEGKSFDPEIHNAIFHIEDETLGDNIVVEELQKGYKYKEKVIRHSMVKVAN